MSHAGQTMLSARPEHALLDGYHYHLTGLVSMQIISIARSVTFMCIGAILFGTQHVGNMDLALLPVIDSINHNSSSLVSFLSFELFQIIFIDIYCKCNNRQSLDTIIFAMRILDSVSALHITNVHAAATVCCTTAVATVMLPLVDSWWTHDGLLVDQ